MSEQRPAMRADPDSGDALAVSADAFAAGEHGDLRGLAPAIAGLGARADDAARSWRFALRTLHWWFDPEAAPAPRADDVRALLGAPLDVRLIAARGCAIAARAALAAFDDGALAEWLALHERLVADVAGGAGRLEWRAGVVWRDLLARDIAPDGAACKALFDDASELRAPRPLVEAAMLRAVAAHAEGQPAEARDLARRAARIAQAESLPDAEYLTTLTVARLRRQLGSPNLALHVLRALARVAPPQMHGWIAWEMLLSGGVEVAAPLLEGEGGRAGRFAATPAVKAATAVAALLDAAGRGDPLAVLADALRSAVSSLRAPAREAQILLACLDPTVASDGDAEAWTSGAASEIPAGLHGVAALGHTRAAPLAQVLAHPGRPGRRLFPMARTGVPTDVHRVGNAATSTQALRTEGGLATLALAGPEGLSRAEFFQALYGFPFASGRHRGVLDVLVHRMREELGGAGAIVRDEQSSRLALHLNAPLLVSDPRSMLPASEYVLRELAGRGAASAQEAADRLGFSLRTVQKELQVLVLNGACVAQRAGNQVTYRIRDTTFTEITRPTWSAGR